MQLGNLAPARRQLSMVDLLRRRRRRERRRLAHRLVRPQRSLKRGARLGRLGKRVLQLQHTRQQLCLSQLPSLQTKQHVNAVEQHGRVRTNR